MLHSCTKFALLVGVAAIVGCAPTPPVISDLESDKVVVVGGLGTTLESVDKMAADGCAVHGRRPAFITRTCLDDYCIRKQFLFACR